MKVYNSKIVKTKDRYIKSQAVKDLETIAMAEARAKYPNNPYLAPRTFRDDTANTLTKCIVKYIELKGGFASRINNTGSYRPELQRFIRSTSKKGIADIMGTYKGKSLNIEVKIGTDRQSNEQKEVQRQIEASGGIYFIAKDFESFKHLIDKL